MDPEVRQIFDGCVRNLISGRQLSPDKPRICYYYETKQAVQLDNCKSQAYRNRAYTVRQIINKEHRHMWCTMKIARPLGWEHLCVSGLSPERKSAIRRCDDRYKEITQPIAQCYAQVFGDRHDGRPYACRSFEHFNNLWQCLESKTRPQNSGRNANNWQQKSEKLAIDYMDCLRDISI